MFNKVGNIKKRTLAFFMVVPLLAITSITTTPCPVCEGTGHLTTTPGMENVKIREYDTWEWRVFRDGCSLFTLFYYDVDVTLFNEGEEEVEGWLEFTLINATYEDRRPVMDTQYRPVNMSAQTVSNLSYTIVFVAGADAHGVSDVEVKVMEGDIPDPTCEGSGRVPVNTWIFVDNFKDTFMEHIREDTEFKPPRHIDPDDYHFDDF